MYFTGRAGSILRYDTRSGGGGRVEGSMGDGTRWRPRTRESGARVALSWRSSNAESGSLYIVIE